MSATKPHPLLSIILALSMAAALLIVPGNTPSLAYGETASYIVQGASADRVAGLVEARGGTITSRLDIIHGVGANLSPEAVSALQTEPGITAVTPNATLRIDSLYQNGAGDGEAKGLGQTPETDYPDVVGAQAVWAAGVDGTGVTVAVLDTGIGRHKGVFKGCLLYTSDAADE